MVSRQVVAYLNPSAGSVKCFLFVVPPFGGLLRKDRRKAELRTRIRLTAALAKQQAQAGHAAFGLGEFREVYSLYVEATTADQVGSVRVAGGDAHADADQGHVRSLRLLVRHAHPLVAA